MISPDYCLKMARYNEWMNSRLYALCADMTNEERTDDRGLFFGSIHSTLNHLLYGDIAWMSRFLDREDEVPDIGKDLYADFTELTKTRVAWDNRMIEWSRSVNTDWLEAPFTFTSKVDGASRTKPAWVLVAHMYNHGTHHRGQLTTVLSQMGYDYGSTDIPFLPD